MLTLRSYQNAVPCVIRVFLGSQTPCTSRASCRFLATGDKDDNFPEQHEKPDSKPVEEADHHSDRKKIAIPEPLGTSELLKLYGAKPRSEDAYGRPGTLDHVLGSEVVDSAKAAASSCGKNEDTVLDRLLAIENESLEGSRRKSDDAQPISQEWLKEIATKTAPSRKSLIQDRFPKPRSLSEAEVARLAESLNMLESLDFDKTSQSTASPSDLHLSHTDPDLAIERHDEQAARSAERKLSYALFKSEPLGIFVKVKDQLKLPTDSLWRTLAREELSRTFRRPPRNGFEEMIQWTEDGKIWQYPLDNEFGWEEEEETSFADHVFLEHFLDDFPKEGPIREFMFLVIQGLSQNPYISVHRKREHIQWFRRFFEEKQQEILQQHKEEVEHRERLIASQQ